MSPKVRFRIDSQLDSSTFEKIALKSSRNRYEIFVCLHKQIQVQSNMQEKLQQNRSKNLS